MTKTIDMISSRFLYYKTLRSFEQALEQNEISAQSIVFIETPRRIWTHGMFFSGGGGGAGGYTFDISTPIFYYTYTEKGSEIPTTADSYSQITSLTSTDDENTTGTASIPLSNQFLYLAVPTSIQADSIVITSNNERINIGSAQSVTIDGTIYSVYKYEPALAPQNLTLTFTFNL